MIPIQELRIGNIFWEDYGGYKIVTAIGFNNVGEFPNHVQGRAIGGKVSGLFDADKIDPVPLSGEVLEACGFELDSDGKWYVFPNTGIGVFYDLQQVCIGQFLLEELVLSSFHQLQNLIFSLTGKELVYKP